ncbi:MAG: trigger factor [Acholeplasmatales bacterium]|nr:trigger factor [Acholeplasmatales bacterium]
MKIGNYKGLEIGKEEFVPVTGMEVEREITNLLRQKVAFNTKEGKSELGDTVNIDYKGLLDDVAFEGGTAEKYDLELGSHSFIPGFEDQLVGYEAGSDVDVNVTFPEEYHAPNLAGKAVVFKCHIHEVKQRVTPEFNDEFAKEFGLESAEALKTELEKQMNLKKKEDLNNAYMDKLMRAIVDDSEVEIPDDVAKAKVDEMYGYYESQIAQYGLDINTYLQMQNMTVEAFRDELAKQAMEAAKFDVVVDEIRKLENILVTEEEIEKEFLMYKDYYNIPEEEYNNFKATKKDAVENHLLMKKTAEYLMEVNN